VEIPTELTFRVAPRTMQMLGRESISSATTGVVELVKNAYDADGGTVTVAFSTDGTDNRLEVIDDGEGMSTDDLSNKWMVISTGNKQRIPLTEKKRVKVGEKGIGRLVLDRLARAAILTTYRKGEPNALELSIDWSRYETEEGDLTGIGHPLRALPPPVNGSSGTRIQLLGLRDRWSQSDFEQLHTELSLLVPPFTDVVNDFSIELQCPYPELNGSVQSPMAEAAELVLSSDLDDSGSIIIRVSGRSAETRETQLRWQDAFSDVAPGSPPRCGPVSVSIRFYLRQAQPLQDTVINRRQIGQFLDQYQGIRIYRDGFWVKPYGGPGDGGDWLGLNARRVASPGAVTSPGYRIGGNQLVGSVFVTREHNPHLYDKTNREGLAENDAFADLKRYLLHLVQFLERHRVSQAKSGLQPPLERVSTTLSRTKTSVEKVRKTIEVAINAIPRDSLFATSDKADLETAIDDLEQIGAEISRVEEGIAEEHSERQLLMGLATTGIAMVAFGHETIHPITSILNRVSMLRSRVGNLESVDVSDINKQIDQIESSAEQTRAWGKYALDSVRRDRRTQRLLDVNVLVRGVYEAFADFLQRKGINFEAPDLFNDLPKVKAFQMDIEAILVNLLTNAVEALRHTPKSQRLIRVKTLLAANGRSIEIKFADSGRGIPDPILSEIFNPMFSTRVDSDQKPVGTGMGLTIVRSLLANYDGTIEAEGASDLGGAEFTMRIPSQMG
jgi:signal transduction histidine kinase